MIEVNLGISTGDKFKSYEEIVATLESIEREHHVQFYRKDSRTIRQVRDRITRPMDEHLIFYSIKYSCIRGSPRYKKEKNRLFPEPLDRDDLCPAHLYLIVSESGSELKVSSINNMHNHQIIAETCRKKCGVNKCVKELTIEGPTAFITVAYLKNLLYREKEKYTTNLQLTCERLLQDSESSLFFGDKGLHGVSFSTERMRSLFAAYPELVYIDLSYDILPYRTPLYMMIVQDGNDRGHIVGLAILFIENKDSIKWFLNTFKIVTESDGDRIDSIIVDKDFLHRNLIQEAFPSAALHLTIVQIFQHFQRDLNFKDMNISPAERTLALKHLQRLVCSKTDNEFAANLNHIERNSPPCVRRYLDKWIPTKNEWCPRLGRICKFLNTADDHLPEMISIIKSNLDSSVSTIMERAFLVMEFLSNKYEDLYIKIALDKLQLHPCGTVLHEYESYLTEFAFKKVSTQIHQMDKIDAHQVENYFITSTSGIGNGNQTTIDNCTCHFYKTMFLPCKHILKVRSLKKENCFAPHLCHQKWTQIYYLKHGNGKIYMEYLNKTKGPHKEDHFRVVDCQPEKESLNNESSNRLESVEDIDQSRFQEKHAKILEVCGTIADTASRDTEDNFDLISDLLWNIMNNLKQGNYQYLRELKPCLSLEKSFKSDDDTSGDVALNIPEERSESSTVDNCDSKDAMYIQRQSEDQLIENVKLQDKDSESLASEEQHDCPIPKKRAKVLNEESRNSNCVSSQRRSSVTKSQQNVPFLEKSVKDKQELILSFILKDDVRKEKMSNYQLSDLRDYDQIDNRISYVNLSVIESFFSENAWAFVTRTKKRKTLDTWFCNICKKAFFNHDSSIECSYCLNWSHTDCVIIKQEQGGFFKCPRCEVPSFL